MAIKTVPAALTAKCAQEIVWSMADDPQGDLWEYIESYIDCGPIDYKGKEFQLDADDLYDAVERIR